MNNILNIKTPAESVAQTRKADYNLSNHGIGNLRLAYWNLPVESLYEEAVFRGEGVITSGDLLLSIRVNIQPGQPMINLLCAR